jgi:hypothetical protein
VQNNGGVNREFRPQGITSHLGDKIEKGDNTKNGSVFHLFGVFLPILWRKIGRRDFFQCLKNWTDAKNRTHAENGRFFAVRVNEASKNFSQSKFLM